MTTNESDDWPLIEAILASAAVRTVYIWGPPGSGKTFAALHLGRLDQGVSAVTLTGDTTTAELRGHFIFKGGDAMWHDGPVVRAMRRGGRLVINEISQANPDVLALLMPVLESLETAEMALPSGETIRPMSGFRVVVTDNFPPDDLPEALRDRFVASIEVGRPHPAAMATLWPEFRAMAEAAAAIADDRRMSIRAWQSIQLLASDFGLATACRIHLGRARGQMVYDALEMARRTRLGFGNP